MNIYEEKDSVVVTGLSDFRLSEILECGQCFYFDRLADEDYEITAMGRAVRAVWSDGCFRIIGSDMSDFTDIWEPYFDLRRDYADIKKKVIHADSRLAKTIEGRPGIRILNQDFFETLISFIISQNKNISQIKQCVKNISNRFGREIIGYNGGVFHAFPEPCALAAASDEEIRRCKVGFRAPYIQNAAEAVHAGRITNEKLDAMNTRDARELLMTIKGVGEKVANCVLLFGLGRREAFPVDVWMKRIMEQMYFDGADTKKSDIEAFAADKFGEMGGYAQQYLFDYARCELAAVTKGGGQGKNKR